MYVYLPLQNSSCKVNTIHTLRRKAFHSLFLISLKKIDKLYKKHLLGALGHCIISVVTWGRKVFRVSPYAPSPMQLSQGWSGPWLLPSSYPQISPLQSKPPSGFLCGFTCGLTGPLLDCSRNAQPSEDLEEWASCKSFAADFCRLTECPPASDPAHSWCWVCYLLSASSIRSSQGAVSMLLQCTVGTSAAFPGQPAAANQRLCGEGLLLILPVPEVSLWL